MAIKMLQLRIPDAFICRSCFENLSSYHCRQKKRGKTFCQGMTLKQKKGANTAIYIYFFFNYNEKNYCDYFLSEKYQFTKII